MTKVTPSSRSIILMVCFEISMLNLYPRKLVVKRICEYVLAACGGTTAISGTVKKAVIDEITFIHSTSRMAMVKLPVVSAAMGAATSWAALPRITSMMLERAAPYHFV